MKEFKAVNDTDLVSTIKSLSLREHLLEIETEFYIKAYVLFAHFPERV
jgi:hypothetical protein